MRGISETVRYDWGKITTPGPCSTWWQEHQCGQVVTPIAGPGRTFHKSQAGPMGHPGRSLVTVEYQW